MNHRDNIYQNKQDIIKPFNFDKKTTDVFDDMAKRSIPCYDDLQTIISKLIITFYKQGTIFYDVGCSTGNTIVELFRHTDKQIDIIAIDKSKDMLDIAKSKCSSCKIDWICKDIEDIYFRNASVINATFILQFVRPEKRQNILKNMFLGLGLGGLLILSEKIVSDNQKIEQALTRLYEDFKINNNYTRLEIEQKNKALKDVLIPFTIEKYLQILKQIGFSSIHIIFNYLNFISLIAIK